MYIKWMVSSIQNGATVKSNQEFESHNNRCLYHFTWEQRKQKTKEIKNHLPIHTRSLNHIDWLRNPLVLPDSGLPSTKWPVNKTYTPRSVCHIVCRTALSPAENRPNKGKMVKKKAMTDLSHSTPPLTRHKHQSLPSGSGSERPFGCNLSQDRRRWHGS